MQEITKNDIVNYDKKSYNVIKSGDTDSLFCLIKSLDCVNDLESTIKSVKQIENNVNKLVQDYFEHQIFPHFGQSKENLCIDFKTEMIISSMLFLKKKMYMLKVLAKEDVVLESPIYKPVGIPIKKSNYSKYFKSLMKGMLDLIMTRYSYTIPQIREALVLLIKKHQEKIKEELSVLKLENIGTPYKWSMGNYKTNSQINPFLLYNTISEAEEFKPGDNAYKINIILTDFRAFNNIAGTESYYISKDDVYKVNFLAVPFNYTPIILGERLRKYKVKIDTVSIISSLTTSENKILSDLIELIKSTYKFR